MKSQSVVILKPDIIQKKLVNLFLTYLTDNDLRIIKKYRVRFSLDTLIQFYGWEKADHPDVLSRYLCSSELNAIVIGGSDAVSRLLKIKNKIRSQYSASPYENLLHCSESDGDFSREYGLLQTISIMNSNGEKNEKSKRTDNQVELIVYKFDNKEPLFLLLKRTKIRGAFWQPITGNVENDESFEQAALRELKEETGILIILKFINTNFSFDFFDDGRIQHEEIFGAEIANNTEIRISSEHSEYVWATLNEADKLLKYPGNKRAFAILHEILKKNGG